MGVSLRNAGRLARVFTPPHPRPVLLELLAEADHMLSRMRKRLLLRHGRGETDGREPTPAYRYWFIGSRSQRVLLGSLV